MCGSFLGCTAAQNQSRPRPAPGSTRAVRDRRLPRPGAGRAGRRLRRRRQQRAAARLRPDSVARIAERVEHERGLRFERRPQPLTVTQQQARREGLASLDADYPPARRRAEAEVLALLGLVPRGTDLRETAAETFGESVAGYYDPRSGRLRIVKSAQSANRVLYEMTVAHELTHALEDQRFDFDLDELA